MLVYEAMPEYLPCKTLEDLNYFLLTYGEYVGN